MNTYVGVSFVHDHGNSYCSLSFIDDRQCPSMFVFCHYLREQGNVIRLVSVYIYIRPTKSHALGMCHTHLS